MLAKKILTSWRILKDATVVIMTLGNFKLSCGQRFAYRTTCYYFDFTSIILTCFWDVKVVHAVVRQFIARALFILLLLIFSKQKNY